MEFFQSDNRCVVIVEHSGRLDGVPAIHTKKVVVARPDRLAGVGFGMIGNQFRDQNTAGVVVLGGACAQPGDDSQRRQSVQAQ